LLEGPVIVLKRAALRLALLGQRAYVIHEWADFVGHRHPVAVEDLGERVLGRVEHAVGFVVAAQVPGLKGSSGVQPTIFGVHEDGLRNRVGQRVLVGGGLGAADGFGVGTDVEAAFEEEPWRALVVEDKDGFVGTGSDLEPEAAFAGGEQRGNAPSAVGAAHHEDAPAVLHAEQEARAKLVYDNDALGVAKHFAWDAVVGRGHKLLQDRFAGFDAPHVVFARGQRGVELAEERCGKKQGD